MFVVKVTSRRKRSSIPRSVVVSRAAGARSALVLGLIRAEPDPSGGRPQYFNSVLGLDTEVAWYDKHHLVPFAEFFPVPDFVRAWLRVLDLPYSDFTKGAAVQAPLTVAGIKLSASVCYEDAYSLTRRITDGEIARLHERCATRWRTGRRGAGAKRAMRGRQR